MSAVGEVFAAANKAAANGGTADRAGGRSLLVDYVDKRVGVVTNDGRLIVGRLRGFDQVCNIIMDKCIERIFVADQGVESVDHGVYVLRGDNV